MPRLTHRRQAHARGARLWRHGSLSSKPPQIKATTTASESSEPRTPTPGIQGSSFDPMGVGRRLAVTPFAAPSPLDGRVAACLQMPAAGYRQPVGLANPLPD